MMLSGLFARVRSLWNGVRGHDSMDADMSNEFRLHMELRAADLVRTGLAPAEAARLARLEFGSTERYKDEGRVSRGLKRVDEMRISWLDFKLGFRMLARYPGLTLVGGLAMAFAIWVGSATFELVTQVLRPTIPLPEGRRIVAIRLWDASTNRVERSALHDFVAWRGQLRSIEEIGAARTLARNLIIAEGGRGEPVEVAEISASAFRLARVAPFMGRTLVEADERPGAFPVVVIGYDLWRGRFNGDTAVIGRLVRLGSAQSTVVGVMPKGFGFPVAQSFWIPLRLNVLEYRRRQAPSIQVFGRLAPGVSLAEAQAELTALGARAAVDFRETHEHLRPQVMPYTKSIIDLSGWRSVGVMTVNLPLVLLLLLICANVALLMFARAATRETEIVVRSALGASRGRIIMQLFSEALVLGGVAAVIGLVATGSGLRWVMSIIEAEFLNGARLPFWFHDSVSPTTVLYAALLTVLSAVIAGVVPALKVTRGVGARLRASTAGAGGLQFGGMWTVVIVIQVAVTVAFPVVAFAVRRDAVKLRSIDVGFPAKTYLSARLEMDRETAAAVASDTSQTAFRSRFEATYADLERRLRADPAVVDVTYGDRLPRMYHPHRLVEVDAGGAAPLNPQWPAYRVSSASVDPSFFQVVGVPVLAGRGFSLGDVAPDERKIIVNESFVRLVLGGRNPIGRRVRYVLLEERSPRQLDTPGPWYEIVGVVRDMGMAVGADVGQAEGGDPKVAGFYHPISPGGAYPTEMAIQLRGEPTEFAPRLRALATAANPTLRLYDIVPLDQVNKSELDFLAFWFRILLMVSGIALLLSLAGVYSVMAFTVARRTREIGVRIALGANRRRVLTAVFARPLKQVSLGITAGAILTGVLLLPISAGYLSARQIALVILYALIMLGVCLLACVVPTRRALRVEPTEALRAEG